MQKLFCQIISRFSAADNHGVLYLIGLEADAGKKCSSHHMGSYKGNNIVIQNTDQAKATLTIPAESKPGDTLHIICEVTDNGTPALTSYKRIIVTVK